MQTVIGVAQNEDKFSFRVVGGHHGRASQSHLRQINEVDTTKEQARRALLDAQQNGRVTHVHRVSRRQWTADFIVNPAVAQKVDNEFNRTCIYCTADLSAKSAYAIGNGYMCAPNCEGVGE